MLLFANKNIFIKLRIKPIVDAPFRISYPLNTTLTYYTVYFILPKIQDILCFLRLDTLILHKTLRLFIKRVL